MIQINPKWRLRYCNRLVICWFNFNQSNLQGFTPNQTDLADFWQIKEPLLIFHCNDFISDVFTQCCPHLRVIHQFIKQRVLLFYPLESFLTTAIFCIKVNRILNSLIWYIGHTLFCVIKGYIFCTTGSTKYMNIRWLCGFLVFTEQ